jgi:hypothetical protein
MRGLPSLLSVRLVLIGLAATLVTFLLDPALQGSESALGLSDTAAHAVAFYLVTLGAYIALPNVRRTDAAGAVLVFAAATELLQGLTGRSMSLGDLGANAAGILGAVLPALVDRWRYAARVRLHEQAAQRASLVAATE